MKYNICIVAIIFAFVSSCNTARNTSTLTDFSEVQLNVIKSGSSDSPLRVFKINNYKDSLLLRTKSSPVSVKNDKELLTTLVQRMITTMTDSLSMGVGIAAPQVGILKNVIIVQRFDKEDFPIESYLNPKIVQYSKKTQPCREGCLSIPGRSDTLNVRAYAILLEYDKLDGEHYTEMVEDFTAVIFQHEIDHLNGILYLDHLKEEVANSKN